MFWKRIFTALLFSFLVLGCSSYGDYIEAGDAQYSRGNYEGAYNYYKRALAEKPESEEAQMKVDLAAKELLKEYDRDAGDAVGRGDFVGAVLIAKKAYDKFPDDRTAQGIIQFAADESAAASDRFEQEGDYATALMLDENVAASLPPFSESFAERADGLRSNWAGALRLTAPVAEKEGRIGDALLQYSKIHALTGDAEASRKKTVLKKAVIDEHPYIVKTKSGGSLAAAVSDKITALNVGTLMVMTQPSKTPNATLAFKLGRTDFGKNVSRREDSVDYQSGTKQVENPFYQNRLDTLEREERELVNDENDVTKLESDVARYEDAVAKEGDTPGTSTGAEQNLSRARSGLESARRSLSDQRNRVQRAREDLRDEPQFKDEPVYSTLKYKVETVTVSARVKMSGALKHTDKRPEVDVKQPFMVEASDETHNAYPVANIGEDPLDLPGNDVLTADIVDQASVFLSGHIADSFQGWRDDLLHRALAAPTEGERTNGIVAYILTHPQLVKPEALLELKAASGIPDALEVLQ